METILHHLTCMKNPVKIIGYLQYQLVSRFFFPIKCMAIWNFLNSSHCESNQHFLSGHNFQDFFTLWRSTNPGMKQGGNCQIERQKSGIHQQMMREDAIHVTPQKINIEPGNDGLEDDFPKFQGCSLRFHVNLPACILQETKTI